MFAVVHLPQFALQAALRHEPELWARPIALVDPALNTPAVCELTAPAKAAGVAEGQTPTQALARCSSITVRHRSPANETAATEAVLQCAYSFSPHIEASAPGLCTLDLRGLAVLSGGDAFAFAAWAGRLRSALAGLNLRARIGLGATPNIARHAALWSQEFEVVSDPGAFIATLPVAALAPSSDVELILKKWGIRTVGELLALGQEALVDRLGLEALALFAAASTTALRPLNLVRPAERFEESIQFEHEVETIEPLLFILRRFVDQLSHRLEFLALVAEELVLRLRLESGELLERRLRLPQPTREADVLFRMLHTHLETLRTDAPIAAVTLVLSPGEPARKQFGLFETVLRDPQQFQETLARLAALLGADRVGAPVLENSHRPDAFRLAPPDFENAPVPNLDGRPVALQTTPVRRFRPPLKARVETTAPAARGPQTPSPPFEGGEGRGEEGLSEQKLSISPALSMNGSGCDGTNLKSMSTSSPRPSPPSDGGEGGACASRPVSVRCAVIKGQLKIAVGPWRASGRWWEPAAWQRDEWDVQTRSGAVLRLSQQPDGWFVEGVLD